jgi:hypothetical protein
LERVSARAAIVLGVALMLPSLFLGWFADDWMLLRDLRLGGGEWRAALQLYQFSRHWPKPGLWFAAPDYRTDFLRPFGGLLILLDARLGALFGHFESLLWWAILLVIVARLYRKLLPAPIAAIALVLYAIDDVHWMPVVWLANRHALVATTFVLAGLLAQLSFRDWRGAALSIPAFAMGLSTSEAAVQALVYVFVLEWFARDRRLSRLIAPSLLIVLYAGLRRPLGAGVSGSGQYFDPLAQPFGFLRALPERVIALLGDLFGGLPSDLWFALPGVEIYFLVIGAVVAAVLIWLTWRTLRILEAEQARTLKILLVAGFLALLPGAAGVPGSRLLFASSFAGSALVATLLVRLPSRICWWLLAVHLVIAPFMLLADQGQAIGAGRTTLRSVAASDLDGDVVVISAPDSFVSIYPPYVEEVVGKRRFRSYRVLTLSPHDLVLSRPGERTLKLTSTNGPFFDSPVEKFLLPRPLPAGTEAHLDVFKARVQSASELLFDFDVPLESLKFLRWHDQALRLLPLPPVGGQVTIPREPGMMGM